MTLEDLDEQVNALAEQDAELGALRGQLAAATAALRALEDEAQAQKDRLGVLEAVLQQATEVDEEDVAAQVRAFLRDALGPLTHRVREYVERELRALRAAGAEADKRLDTAVELAMRLGRKLPNGGTQGH
jgi:small-conductance mechanosensitive channel